MNHLVSKLQESQRPSTSMFGEDHITLSIHLKCMKSFDMIPREHI